MSVHADIEVVLFDVGGVLVELTGVTELIAWTGAKLDAAALWRWWLSSDDVRAFETGASEANDFADAVVHQLGLPISRETFIEKFTLWPRRVFPGARELLGELSQNHRLATLSNTNSLHWPRITQEMALSEPFTAHFPSHLTGHIKPDSAAFEQAGEYLQSPLENILFLDDNQINVDAARSTGMAAHRVEGPVQAREVLTSLDLL